MANSHYKYTAYCSLSYWREVDGNSVAETEDGPWTHVVVGPLRRWTAGGDLKLTREQDEELKRLLVLLEYAYECGREAMRREVCETLGIGPGAKA